MTDEPEVTPGQQPDEQQAQAETSAPAQEPSAPPPVSGSSETEEGRTFAILSYALNFIGLPFFLIPLIMRNNEFSLYHAKQNLMLWLVGMAGIVVSRILMMVCIGIILMLVLMIFLLVLNIIGLINAVKGEQKPLPVVGRWAEDWFKGLNKA